MISASDGAIGSTYEISFECEALKNRKMNALQTSSTSIGEKPFGWRGMRSAWRMLCQATDSHGRNPTSSTGTK
jgi:hypothetical protein